MSVTPTNDALIVALDFEGESPQSSSYGSDTLTYAMTIGVHSIERSAQEDTLLVLFNTAISNLVCPVYLCGVCGQVTIRCTGPLPEQLRDVARHHRPLPVLPVLGIRARPRCKPDALSVNPRDYHQGEEPVFRRLEI